MSIEPTVERGMSVLARNVDIHTLMPKTLERLSRDSVMRAKGSKGENGHMYLKEPFQELFRCDLLEWLSC